MELLKKLYGIYSPSGQGTEMCNFIVEWVYENVQNVNVEQDNTGNLFITKGIADTYPCVAAHLDQVQRLHSDDFVVLCTQGLLFGYSPSNKRQEGLGADDKNGIWVALNCLKKFDVLKVAFFVGEEVGCVGSKACDMDFFANTRFVLQVDRRDNGDLVTDIYDEMCSPEFLNDVRYEKFGYNITNGLMTDVATLKERGLKVSCVNMSCGYYEPHTDHEFTIMSELENTLAFVENIIENCTDVYPHVPKPRRIGYSGLFDDYDGWTGRSSHYYDQHFYEYDIYDMIGKIVSYNGYDNTLTFADFYKWHKDEFCNVKKRTLKRIFKEYMEDYEFCFGN